MTFMQLPAMILWIQAFSWIWLIRVPPHSTYILASCKLFPQNVFTGNNQPFLADFFLVVFASLPSSNLPFGIAYCSVQSSRLYYFQVSTNSSHFVSSGSLGSPSEINHSRYSRFFNKTVQGLFLPFPKKALVKSVPVILWNPITAAESPSCISSNLMTI